jgi:hypothetical protein
MLLLSALLLVAGQEAPVDGNAVIRGKVGTSEIVITTTARLAGAIHSLRWNGIEFIDSFDHGRQLQAACSFDCGKPGFHAECYNPTEAGSRRDGQGPKSTSELLKLRAEGNVLETTTRMAFWLAPGEKSENLPALNDRILSAHRVSKRVQIGVGELARAIRFDITFHVPEGETHTLAQFEALTGYMPAGFSKFHSYDPKLDELANLADGPGEQALPVILARPDGSAAMGVWSPDQPSKGFESAGYGRFRFPTERVVKWNCVFRVRDPKNIPAGDYRYRVFVAVGTLEEVRATLKALARNPG